MHKPSRGGRELVFSDPGDAEFLLSAPLTYNFTIPIRADQPTSFASYGYLQQRGAQGLPSVNGSEAVTGPLGSVITERIQSAGNRCLSLPSAADKQYLSDRRHVDPAAE